MEPVRLISTVLFQGSDVASSDQFKWLVIFVGVLAFCSFVQFLVFVGAGIAALKAWKTVSAEIDAVKQKAFPLVATFQGLADEAKPKIRTITDNTVQVSEFVKTKLQEYEGTIDQANQTLKDLNLKTRAQVDRVDGMVSSALKATSDVGNTIHRGIKTPVLEVAGVVNGLKAALDVLVGRSKIFTDGSARPYGSPVGSSSRPSGGTPGPVRVPSHEASGSLYSSNPSSAVAPSPAAAAVVDQIRSEKVKTIY